MLAVTTVVIYSRLLQAISPFDGHPIWILPREHFVWFSPCLPAFRVESGFVIARKRCFLLYFEIPPLCVNDKLNRATTTTKNVIEPNLKLRIARKKKRFSEASSLCFAMASATHIMQFYMTPPIIHRELKNEINVNVCDDVCIEAGALFMYFILNIINVKMI